MIDVIVWEIVWKIELIVWEGDGMVLKCDVMVWESDGIV